MKKKASLLISGITTVAMLAVAVGSFAAWDTLKTNTNVLDVSTSTPVVVEIKEAGNTAVQKVLVPGGDSVIVDESKEASNVCVGSFKATLSQGSDKSGKISTSYTATVSDTKDGVANEKYLAGLYEDEALTKPITASTGDLALDATDKTFYVGIKFKDSDADATTYTGETGVKKFINVELVGAKK